MTNLKQIQNLLKEQITQQNNSDIIHYKFTFACLVPFFYFQLI